MTKKTPTDYLAAKGGGALLLKKLTLLSERSPDERGAALCKRCAEKECDRARAR